jgi:cell fate regulator YaaT (PSP1 superfamily)
MNQRLVVSPLSVVALLCSGGSKTPQVEAAGYQHSTGGVPKDWIDRELGGLESGRAMPDESHNSQVSVVGIRFKEVGKIYHFGTNGVEGLQVGDFVIVNTVRGRELGQVAQINVKPEHRGLPLKPVERRATARDMALRQQFKAQEKKALSVCRQKTEELGLPIRIAKVEYSYDGRRLTVFFMADDEVDHRSLRKKLARHFRTRVHMQSLGARDFAKMLGGCGACGGPLCCSTFLTEFTSISIKTAKVQDVALIPSEITGMCGRLRCCLRYEYQTYKEAKQAMPQKGCKVVTKFGLGKIVEANVIKETVLVDLGTHRVEVPLAGLKV